MHSWQNTEVAAAAPSNPAPRDPLTVDVLLDITETALHSSPAEWIFLRELRVGTGRGSMSHQRLDAFALNALPHTGMRRVCYEAKLSRADFQSEVRHPLKRRIGLRYSNEFCFLTPPGLIHLDELPAECGLVEAGYATPAEWRELQKRHAGMFHYDPEREQFCMVVVPAPWRDTPGPTWQFAAAMMRNQWRQLSERPPERAKQERLPLL